MDEAIKQRDVEWKEELDKRDKMWRDELKKRYQMYWQGHYIMDDEMVKMIEGREKAINDSLTFRDQRCLDSLDSYNHNLKSLYNEQVNLRKTMESIALR